MRNQYEKTDYATLEEYQSFREAVGWPKINDAQAKAGLDHTYYIVCMRKEGKAVAMGRLLWDQGYVVYIADVMVLPEFQGKGLGRALIEGMLERLREKMQEGDKVMITLVAAEGKADFYKKFGFLARPAEGFGPGMHLWIAK